MSTMYIWITLIYGFKLQFGISEPDYCPSLENKKLDIICFTPANNTVSCNKSLEHNSRAVFRCRDPIYSQPREQEYYQIICKNGEWDQPLIDDFCERECGRAIPNIAPKTNGSSDEEVPLYFPWNAKIYELENEVYSLRCEGTLISLKVVVSIATCFDDDFMTDNSTLKVALGNIYRNINSTEDRLSQIREVKEIVFPAKKSDLLFPEGDIALVLLKEEIEITLAISPVCIDIWRVNFEEELLERASRELVSILDYNETKAKNGLKKETIFIKAQFLSKNKCKRELRDASIIYRTYVTDDRFCAKIIEPVSCSLYSDNSYPTIGQGLVFEETTTKRYYLLGILTTITPCHKNRSSVNMALSTKVSLYKLFLDRYIQDECEPLYSKKLVIECFYPWNLRALCDNFLPSYSRATFRCDHPNYRQIRDPKYTEIICRNGVWDRPLVEDFCEGEKSKATASKDLGFPWHAQINKFDSETGEWRNMCSGTLISSKVVISAANCLIKHAQSNNFSKLRITLGKLINLTASEDTFIQIRERKGEGEGADKEKEEDDNEDKDAEMMVSDISFIVLKEKVEYTSAVLPICIDIDEVNFENEQLVSRRLGKIIGYEVKRVNGSIKQAPKIMLYAFLSSEECTKKVELPLPMESTWSDSFCAVKGKNTYRDTNHSLYLIKRGEGLVFPDPFEKKYYLRGVFGSYYPDVVFNLGFFTRISYHKDLVKKYIQAYGPPPQNCGYRLGACKNDFDHCFKNEECCSGFCEKEEKLEYGLCKSNYCKPVASEKLFLECFTPFNGTTSCKKRLESGSQVRFRCNLPTYKEIKNPEFNFTTCRNGNWDRHIKDDFCELNCGRPESNLPHLTIRNGTDSGPGYYPWHAGVYELKKNKYDQICGGSLISQKIVISAAHCFTENNKKTGELELKDFALFKISVGNYYRSFNSNQDKQIQIRSILDIEISPNYEGVKSLYEGDIAVVVLEEKVEYTEMVLPICIDVGVNSFEKDQLVNRATGKIVGWGFTNQSKQSSENLKYAVLPIVTLNKCKKVIDDTWRNYLTNDKLCLGGGDSHSIPCGGDSGGGLVIFDQTRNKYFLRGVSSLGASDCDVDSKFGLFTNLAKHKELIKKVIDMYPSI